MAQATLVELQITEGQRLIDRLIRAGVDVTAAAWVKESDSGDWYLYLVTPIVAADGATRPAYRRVNNVIREMQEEGFGMDPFEKKVVGPHNAIAKDIMANRGGRPGGPPTPFRGSRLGDLPVEEAYIYPPSPTPEEIVGMQLWDCGDMTLKPGVGLMGRCRVVVIDVATNDRLKDSKYHGIMADPMFLESGKLEVTWAEGGALRIVDSSSSQRWRWSQARITWDESGCPPNRIWEPILAVME
jgi:hypothetical protein